MRMLALFCLLASSLFGQGLFLGGPSKIGGNTTLSVGIVGVQIRSHASLGIFSSSAGTLSTTTTSITNAGDTVVLIWATCLDSCATAMTGISGTDPSGNTYTVPGNCSILSTAWNQPCLVAKNVATMSAQRITLNWTPGTSVNSFAENIEMVELSGANLTTPLDASVSNNATGSSASPLVNSAGNVTNSGEVALCAMRTNTAFTISGPSAFVLLQNLSGTYNVFSLSNPASGAGITCQGTQGSSAWRASLVSITP